MIETEGRMRKLKLALANIFVLVSMVAMCGPAFAAGVRVVPSAPWVVPGSYFSFDIVAEGIPADGLGGVQFRLNVTTPTGTVTGVADLSQAGASDVAVASPLLISPSTATRSGIGDFFWNGRGNNGILVMDNEPLTNGNGPLTNGTALYTYAHTNGAAPLAGSGTIARFKVRVGAGVNAGQIDINLSDVMLLDGGPAYHLDYNTGASVPLKCMAKVPSLLGLGLGQAQAALAAANLAAGSVYKLNNVNGTLPLNVVLEQSSSSGSDVACQTPVNLAVDAPPAEVGQAAAVDKHNDQTGAVLLSWTPSASGDAGGYRIYKGAMLLQNIGNPGATGTEIGGLPNGVASQLRVTVYDTFGNESQGVTLAAPPIDDVPPAVTINAPATGTVTKVGQATVSGTVNEPVASVTVNSVPA